MRIVSRFRFALAFTAMFIGVLALYTPPALFSGDAALFGIDFWSLHERRLQFVHEIFSSMGWTLPGWYPRELLGTPFWSNLQNFPWIPTRLVLLVLDPVDVYSVGVNLAATLAASFTYLFCRSIQWRAPAAAIAGWTFACAGFFAARVTAGHLPLLEAYPALPLLLWLVERSLQGDERWRRLAALALGSACVVVAGHPQLPAYAVSIALLYALWIGRGRRGLNAAGAIALGAGSTLAVWWPMLELLQRSTRTLPLQGPVNDLALPYERLGALILPWRDGWPAAVKRLPHEPFSGFPSTAYFWDTVNYVGIIPWLAGLGLLIVWLRYQRRLSARPLFFAAMGVSALLVALPWAEAVGDYIPGTYLRSPARLTYLTTFALSLSIGAALEGFLRSSWPRGAKLRAIAAGAVVLLHVFDLAAHDRPFIRTRPRAMRSMPGGEALIEKYLGSGRVAIDYNVRLDLNRRFDDVGFFDSIILARPYRALLELWGVEPDLNMQSVSGSALSSQTLSNLGVHYVITRQRRRDLSLLTTERYHLYSVPNPIPRVAFFRPDQVSFLDEVEMHDRLRQRDFDLGGGMMLPIEAPTTPRQAAAPAQPRDPPAPEAQVAYRRLFPDRIRLEVDAPRPGFVRVLESWDPGWTARLDGRAVPVLRSDTFAIAVEVGPGKQRVELQFRTPGRRTGAIASLICLLLLAWLLRATHLRAVVQSRRNSESLP